jgi:hypothetical protein
VLNSGVGVGEVDEEQLEAFAGVVVGLLDHLNLVNNVFVFKRCGKSEHDLFASARAVSVSDAKSSGGIRHGCLMFVSELCIKR